MGSQLGIQLFQLVATIILSRLILPEYFGYVAMSATVMTLLSYFSDMGMSLAIVSKDNLNKKLISNIFWISLSLGILLSGLGYLSAPLVGQFYEANIVAQLLQWQCLGILFACFNLQPASILRRENNYSKLAKIEISSAVLSNAIGIYMALLGFNAWAIISIPITFQVFKFIFFMTSGSHKHIGLPRFSYDDLSVLKFGSYVGAASFLLYFVRNLDDILIGKVIGAEELAFYARAYTLVLAFTQLFNYSISQVTISTLSDSRRNQIGNEPEVFSQKLSLLAFLSFPFAAGVFAIAADMIPILYGQIWMPTAPLLQILSFSAIGYVLMAPVGWILVSANKVKEYFKWVLITSLVICTAFIISVNYGVHAVAWSYTIAYGFILAPLSFYWLHRKFNFNLNKSLRELSPILLASFIMCIIVYSTREFLLGFDLNPIIRMSLCVLLGIATYIGLGLLLIKPLPVPMLERFFRN